MDVNKEAQNDEILALQSIFNSSEFCMTTECSGNIVINVELPENAALVSCKNDLPASLCHLAIPHIDKLAYKVKYLPPVIIQFKLTDGYPILESPEFELSCCWLDADQIKQLTLKLKDLWDETADVILFTWTSFISDEAWEFLLLDNFLDVSILLKDDKGDNIISKMCIFDYEKRLQIFKESAHKCDVCMEEYLGNMSIQFLPCDHVYCKICMKSYFEVQIKDGEVNGLLCPFEDCKSKALPTQVKELVEKKLFERYERFLLQRSLDQMGDVVRCPRKFCEIPVLLEPSTNMAQCTGCGFIFCSLCSKTWHGDHTACEIDKTKFKEVYQKWLQSDEGERESLYKKYGRRKILRIVEDFESQNWLNENSKPCPKCKTPIQLGVGCNKVVCSACHAYMCYLCGQVLNKLDPYSHYRSGGPCANRLFENTIDHEGDDDDDDDDDFIQFLYDGLVIN